MTVLFFDTETTGFVQDRLPIDHPDQPYPVQLAAQLCEDNGDIIAGFSFIIDNGVPIPERAAAVHGITEVVAAKYGVSAEFALTAFTHLYQRSDLVVAHNAKFDKAVIEAAIARYYAKVMPLRKPIYCTMDAASPLVNLPPTEKMVAAGMTKPKPPKLEEAIRFFFNEELDGAHDAMVDVIACRRIYFQIKAMIEAGAA